MEMVEVGGKVTTKKNLKLVIEDYLDFIEDRTLPLTVNQLRQGILIDMVTTMELMDLHRSTLLDGCISGDACFTVEDVINDLKDLDWQECHVTSLLNQGAVVSSSGEGTIISVKRKRKKGPGRKPTEVGVDHSVISTGTTIAAESTTESLRSADCNSFD